MTFAILNRQLRYWTPICYPHPKTTLSTYYKILKNIVMNKKIITVVTAHQLTADTIATAIGATEKHDGYYLGNGYAVTWTNGGVIEAGFKSSERFILNSGMDPKLILAHNFEFVMRDYDALVELQQERT